MNKSGKMPQVFLYCFSYSPLPVRFKTVKPAFLASETDNFRGELKLENNLRTGFLQAGHCVKGCAEAGRCKVNRPPQTWQSPSQSSYSYNGIATVVQFEPFKLSHDTFDPSVQFCCWQRIRQMPRQPFGLKFALRLPFPPASGAPCLRRRSCRCHPAQTPQRKPVPSVYQA
jgi:hypothetical protein